MKTKIYLFFALLALIYVAPIHAKDLRQQTDTVATVLVDDITITATGYHIDKETNTASIKLTLLSEKDVPREFKLNIYGTQVVDNNRQSYFFQTITMGRVNIRFEDKQNYLHYLLQPDTPVELTVLADNIAPEAEAIHLVKLVFEDSTEEGRFLEAFVVDIPASGE